MSLPCVRPTVCISPPCLCPGIPAYECHHRVYALRGYFSPYVYPSVCISRRVYVASCTSHRVCLIVSISIHIYVPTVPACVCPGVPPSACHHRVRPNVCMPPPCVYPGVPACACHHRLDAPSGCSYVAPCVYSSLCMSLRVYVLVL